LKPERVLKGMAPHWAPLPMVERYGSVESKAEAMNAMSEGVGRAGRIWNLGVLGGMLDGCVLWWD